MSTIVIVNASIVNEDHIVQQDVYIRNGIIEAIGKNLSSRQSDILIDASGKFLLPGLIDDQVHFREPGLTHKADIFSESKAAVAGGITSYMEMPNTLPPATTLEDLEDKYRRASRYSMANYSFYLGATNDNLETVKRIDPDRICGVKVFMGSSTGNMLVDNPATLEQIFQNSPTIIATHCEDTPTIKRNETFYRERYGEHLSPDLHPVIRSAEACYISSSLAVEMARKFHTRLHVLHISTAKELTLFSNLPLSQKHITAEACVHHLFFEEADYMDKGTLLKCNPAIKTRKDRDALQAAVRDGTIDVIATDHAPHTRQEKEQGYFQAPSGLPLVQHSLQSLLEHYYNGIFDLETIVRKTSHAVADLFQIDRRGYLREGYWADAVLVDLKKPYEVTANNILSKCGWSPFEGYTFNSSIIATIVSGHLAYYNDRFYESHCGKRLQFIRS